MSGFRRSRRLWHRSRTRRPTRATASLDRAPVAGDCWLAERRQFTAGHPVGRGSAEQVTCVRTRPSMSETVVTRSYQVLPAVGCELCCWRRTSRIRTTANVSTWIAGQVQASARWRKCSLWHKPIGNAVGFCARAKFDRHSFLAQAGKHFSGLPNAVSERAIGPMGRLCVRSARTDRVPPLAGRSRLHERRRGGDARLQRRGQLRTSCENGDCP